MTEKQMKISKIREYMRENGLDGMIVDSWQNVLYLSGFTGYGDALLFITGNDKFIITDSRYYVQAEVQCGDFTLVKGNARDFNIMLDLVKSNGVKTLGFEQNAVGYAAFVNYYNKLGAELKSVSGLFDNMRLTKSPEEIAAIERSCDIATAALVETYKYIKPGETETRIAARLEYEMRVLGADKAAFDTVVASGIRGSMPHGTATDKIIEKGDGVTIDFGAFQSGMCSDMTRTVFAGEPSAEMRKIYYIVKEAQEAAINGFKPGMTGCDLDKIARDIIEGYGYGEYFGHGLGHGVGIDIHEGVNINRRGTLELVEGMVFSVEPGIYVPGLGGVRIEDLVTPENGRLRYVTKGPSTEMTVL